MSEGIRKYIIISGSILLLIFCLGLCCFFKFQWQLVLFYAYILGVANVMLILGVINYDE